LKSKGVLLSNVELKTRVKSSKECTGNSRIRRFKKRQIQGVLEVWGSVLYKSWRIRALIWRNSCKHCNQHLLHSGWPWWRHTSSSIVDVALSEDEKGWTTINTDVLSLFPYPFYFLILLVINWIIDRLIASVDLSCFSLEINLIHWVRFYTICLDQLIAKSNQFLNHTSIVFFIW